MTAPAQNQNKTRKNRLTLGDSAFPPRFSFSLNGVRQKGGQSAF